MSKKDPVTIDEFLGNFAYRDGSKVARYPVEKKAVM